MGQRLDMLLFSAAAYLKYNVQNNSPQDCIMERY